MVTMVKHMDDMIEKKIPFPYDELNFLFQCLHEDVDDHLDNQGKYDYKYHLGTCIGTLMREMKRMQGREISLDTVWENERCKISFSEGVLLQVRRHKHADMWETFAVYDWEVKLYELEQMLQAEADSYTQSWIKLEELFGNHPLWPEIEYNKLPITDASHKIKQLREMVANSSTKKTKVIEIVKALRQAEDMRQS